MKSKQVLEKLERMKTILVNSDKQTLEQFNKEYIQALSHAINCVGAIEQIKWERDIAIQQLNELGYQFGEKIGSDEE